MNRIFLYTFTFCLFKSRRLKKTKPWFVWLHFCIAAVGRVVLFSCNQLCKSIFIGWYLDMQSQLWSIKRPRVLSWHVSGMDVRSHRLGNRFDVTTQKSQDSCMKQALETRQCARKCRNHQFVLQESVEFHHASWVVTVLQLCKLKLNPLAEGVETKTTTGGQTKAFVQTVPFSFKPIDSSAAFIDCRRTIAWHIALETNWASTKANDKLMNA